MRIYPWGKLPACLFRRIRKLEAYATVRNQSPLVRQLREHRSDDRTIPHGMPILVGPRRLDPPYEEARGVVGLGKCTGVSG